MRKMLSRQCPHSGKPASRETTLVVDSCSVRLYRRYRPSCCGSGCRSRQGRSLCCVPRRQRRLEDRNVPSLAAEPDQFLQWQLVFFRSGARKNKVMAPIADQLSNQDIRDLAAYFSSFKPPSGSGEGRDERPELTEAARKRRPPEGAPHATAIISPVPRPSRASQANARTTWSKHCMTTSPVSVSVAVWRLWPRWLIL